MKPPTLVSAGAGTGKTWRIVRAVVTRVRAGTPVDRVAAVTFTEAAAAELQERLRAALHEEGLAREAARVDTAAVCTIHRFALTLLQRHPLAAGVPPEMRVLDEEQATALRRQCLSALVDGGEARALPVLLEGLLGAGVGLSERAWGDAGTPLERLHLLVRELIEKGASVGMDAMRLRAEGPRAARRVLDVLGEGDSEAPLDAAWREALDAARGRLLEHPEPTYKKDVPFYEALRVTLARADEAVLDQCIRLADVELSKAATPLFGLLVARAAQTAATHPALRRRVAAGVEAAYGIAADILDRYEAEKARLGALDFEDMQRRALDLLTGARAAQGYAALVAATVPFVVVDEFQDTSPMQFRLFEALRVAGAEVHYVGDLKQAIYGFRAADATLFAALLDGARGSGQPVETLDRSRRSRPELVGFANAMFSALLPPHALAYDPLTADNAYARGACPRDTPSVDVVHARDRVRAGIDRLAVLVAAGTPVLDRETGRARPARWGDCAVLAYTHESLRRWAEALRARGVPAVLAARGLYDTLEAQLARAWLRAIASPRDTAAAASVLLSELYGLSQRSVARLALARTVGAPGKALERADAAPEGSSERLDAFERRALARCHEDLRACREAFRQLPLAEAVERAFERVELAERLSLRRDETGAAQVRANLGALVSVAWRLMDDAGLSADGPQSATLEGYLDALERDARRDPWQPVVDDGDGVRLVTLHASKGMEYPIVALDVFGQKLQVRLPRVEVARPDDVLAPGALDACALTLLPDVGVDALRVRLREAHRGIVGLEAEWARLLYVAVTRARDHLVLLWPEDARGGVDTLRGALLRHLPKPPAEPGEHTWLDTRVTVTVVRDEGKAKPAEADTPTRAVDLTAWRALADDVTPECDRAPDIAEVRPSLARVSPSELCQVADCPEVPRLARFTRGEVHAMARATGTAVRVRAVSDARKSRERVGNKVLAARLGKVVHAAIERAVLAPGASSEGDRGLARDALRGVGETEHLDALEALIVDTLASVRAVVAALGAVEEPVSEAPFALDLDGTTVHGVVDLILRASDGVHVIDLKTHLMGVDELPRWAAYYRPQLDAYALAVARITGEHIAGRHLAVPAAGALVTLADDFVADHAAVALASYASLVAREVPGPAQDCARCGWRELCRVGRAEARAHPR